MSEFRGVVFPSEVADRRAAACGEWVTRVRASHLNDIAKDVLTDPRNLAKWWPLTEQQKTEAA